MAGNGPNYRLVYVYLDKTDVWLGIIARLCLLVYSLLYNSAGNLGSLDLINSIIYGLAPDSLALKSAGGGPNIFLFPLF